MINEDFSRLESRNLVSCDGNGLVLRNITGSLLGALLNDEATEATEIHIVTLLKRVFDTLHERFNHILNSDLLEACCFSYFINDFSFSHCFKYLYNYIIVDCEYLLSQIGLLNYA